MRVAARVRAESICIWKTPEKKYKQTKATFYHLRGEIVILGISKSFGGQKRGPQKNPKSSFSVAAAALRPVNPS